MKGLKNNRVLKNFVEQNDLMNSHSIVNFTAIVSIKTSENSITKKNIQVMITFDGYDNLGTLILLDNDLDSNYYPTELSAKWQEFNYKDGEFLIITGFHKTNSAIGNYEIKILPIEKIKE